MGLGTMSYTTALANAEKLQKYSEDMDTLFDQFKTEMEKLNDVLISNSGDRLYERYSEIKNQIPGFSAKIGSFSKYIIETVQEYQNKDNAG